LHRLSKQKLTAIMAISSSGLLLDSCVVIRHFRGGTDLLGSLSNFQVLYLPYVALAELYAGAYRSLRAEKHLQQIALFLDAVDVLMPDEKTPLIYGRVASELAQKGTPIPQNDLWIASIALQTGLPLATHDRHFESVGGLNIIVL
jgi:tRNA(fMet)-specific endonuclease VapC